MVPLLNRQVASRASVPPARLELPLLEDDDVAGLNVRRRVLKEPEIVRVSVVEAVQRQAKAGLEAPAPRGILVTLVESHAVPNSLHTLSQLAKVPNVFGSDRSAERGAPLPATTPCDRHHRATEGTCCAREGSGSATRQSRGPVKAFAICDKRLIS
jgi:hypothetical protein